MPTDNKFNEFIQSIQSHTNSLSSLIFILLFFGLLIAIICVLVINSSVRKDKKIKLDDQKSLLNRKFTLPPLGGMITTYLVQQGWIHVNSISQVFLKGLEFLKKNFGEHALYKLPWYLVLGAKDSGKSTLVNHTQLHEPHNSPDFSFGEPNPAIRWKFFSRGVLIDVAGRLFLNNPESETDTIGWRNLLILLARYRASMPLNGIILCISAKDLYGNEKLSPDALQTRATSITHTINRAQSSLRIRLPIYVVVTNCDIIPGFKSFAQELPNQNQGNILGWSSPYDLQYLFTSNWLDEAFNYLDEKIDTVRTELLSLNVDTRHVDSLFVFSKEILTIKEKLVGYTNRIFHSSTTHEAPHLRGIYFTGDSGIDLSDLTASPDFSLQAHTPNPSLVFLRDLFQTKIFSEIGIARPLTGKVASLNRGVNIIRNTTICFTLIGTYGLFNAYDSFQEKKERIIPVLSKMSSLMRDIQTLRIDEPGHTASLFDTYARQLLEMMLELQQTEFISIMVPASWFSPLHKDLHSGLQVAYQEIVIRTIYVDLLLKARELLQLRPTMADRSTSLAALLNPLTSSEYLLLKKYVDGLYELNDMLFKFNNLKSAPDARDLDSLVMYTFNAHLPESFMGNYNDFRKLLNESSYPLIDLKPYMQMARQTLSIIYENFLNAMFSKNDPLTLVSRIQVLIDQLQSEGHKQVIDLVALRNAVGDLSTTAPSLGEVGSTWMDGKILNLGKEFDTLLDHIDMSPLFGRDVTQYLVDQTAISFNRFKNFLLNANEAIVDKSSNQKSLPPSHGLLTLEKLLSKLFKLSFMALPNGPEFSTSIPVGKIVYWDASLVQQALNIAKDFDSFITKELLSYPLSIQENLKIASRINLQEVLIRTLGKAQTFIDAPKNINPGSASERMLRAQINDFKAVSDTLGRLLEIVKQDDVSKAYLDLRELLCFQSQWLLEHTDTYITQHQIYKMKQDDFDWWDGKSGAAIGAFAVRDINDLKHYITVQREFLVAAVNDFAKPIMDLLRTPAFDGADSRDETLINRWIRITEQVESYSKKQPDNSLAQLENFIVKDLNGWNYKEVIKNLKLKDLQHDSGDYILRILKDIKIKILSRSEVLQRQQAIANYEKLINFFNKNLRGKFPFVGAKLDDNQGEANPEDIREFFDYFKEYGDSTKEVLDQLYQIGPSMKDVVAFLISMENVRKFLQNYLKDASIDKPTFNIKLDFRTSRDQESGANVIVDWYFKTDELTTIDKHDKKTEGSWTYGNSITIGFKWSEDEKMAKPASDSGQPALKVDGATAEFIYDSQWALLWMLRDCMAPQGSFSKVANPNPYVLKFSLPMTDQTYTTVFNSISIYEPSKKPKGPQKIIMVPIFPTEAPDLPDKIDEIKNQAVLTEGIIEASDFNSLLPAGEPKMKDDDAAENPDKEDDENKDKSKDKDKKKKEQ